MYLPTLFREDDIERCHALIRDNPLGLLVSSSADDVQANPVPFLLTLAANGKTLLQCHVARANPQWRHIEGGASVLAIFQGDDSYVSPSWYASKRAHGKVVPTWNYAMVQARGSATIHEDAEWLRAQITALTASHEDKRPTPWQVSDAPHTFIEAQMRGIVGIEIVVEQLTGKWKVSQNRSEADRAGVIDGLRAEGDDAMAEMVGGREHR
jgi:transcriptional regulator